MRTFPLGIQTVLPADYADNRPFMADLEILAGLGFQGVEFNIEDPFSADPLKIKQFVRGFGLTWTMLASGLTAKTRGLSLSSPERKVREDSMAACRKMIEFAGAAGCGVIIGILKGGPSDDPVRAGELFSESLAQIAPQAEAQGVKVLIEATNRYESAVANRLDQAMGFIKQAGSAAFKVLPDTFHMNIEEADPKAALRECRGQYGWVHVSDNNRHFPGLGAIDFSQILSSLDALGYAGGISIEGNIKSSFAEDVKQSAAYLKSIMQGV